MTARVSLILALLLIPALAAAQLTPVSQTRFIDGYFEVVNDAINDFYSDEDYLEATDFGPMDEQVAPAINFLDTNVDLHSNQISSIEPLLLQAIVESAGYADNSDPDVFVDGNTSANYEVEFQLDAPHDYVLYGSGYAEGNTYGNVSLYDEFGTPLESVDVSNDNVDHYLTGTLPAGTYWFFVDSTALVSIFGEGSDGGEISMDYGLELTSGPSAVGDIIGSGSFVAASPNPMTDATTVSFALGRGGPVALEVLDLRGRRVRTFAASGTGRVHWDGRTDTGAPASSGMYFLRARSGGETVQGRVTLVR